MNAAVMNALNTYRQTGIQAQVMDASPHRLIQMLFEGAMGRIAAARGCMERRNFGQKSRAISEAMAIVVGLRNTLDFDKGGEISRNLNDLYAYMTRRLAEANRTNDTAILDEVSSLLGNIMKGWNEIPAEYRNRPAQ